MEQSLLCVITAMSLCLMCDISCPRTASSSSLSRSFNMPLVTQILPSFLLFPKANAFGMFISAIPILGFGTPAFIARSPIIDVSSVLPVLTRNVHASLVSTIVGPIMYWPKIIRIPNEAKTNGLPYPKYEMTIIIMTIK